MLEQNIWKKENWIIILLAGVLLFVISLPTNGRKAADVKEQSVEVETEQTYREELQAELAAFLSQIEGVGRSEVLIYMETKEEKGITSNQTSRKITGVIVSAQGAAKEEIRLRIVKMVTALYHLSADAVEVYPMKQ